MLFSAIAKAFPDAATIPKELLALCQFVDQHDQAISGCFEFDTDGRNSVLAWFDNDPEPASEFAIFGCGPDGSQYGFWLYGGRPANEAPVVLLDSECVGSQVIATSFRDFLRLLAIGYDEPGTYPTLEPENPASAAALRKWILDEYGLVSPPTGAELVATAQSNHPDLMAWIEAWQDRHFKDV